MVWLPLASGCRTLARMEIWPALVRTCTGMPVVTGTGLKLGAPPFQESGKRSPTRPGSGGAPGTVGCRVMSNVAGSVLATGYSCGPTRKKMKRPMFRVKSRLAEALSGALALPPEAVPVAARTDAAASTAQVAITSACRAIIGTPRPP